MKISLLFTLLSKSNEKDDSVTEELKVQTIKLIQLIKKQYKDKKYNIVRMVTGLHSNSNRLHTHIGHILEYPEKDHVKNWDKKDVIASIRKACPDGYDFKVSYYLENDPKYDEEFGLCYCLKEYENYEKIDFKTENENVTDEQLEELRKYGNDKYKKSISENERNERRKLQSESESEDIEQFIYNAILEYDYKNNLLLGYEETEHLHGRTYNEFTIQEKYDFVRYQINDYFGCKAEKTGKPILKMAKRNQINDYAYMYLLKDPKNRWQAIKIRF